MALTVEFKMKQSKDATVEHHITVELPVDDYDGLCAWLKNTYGEDAEYIIVNRGLVVYWQNKIAGRNRELQKVLDHFDEIGLWYDVQDIDVTTKKEIAELQKKIKSISPEKLTELKKLLEDI